MIAGLLQRKAVQDDAELAQEAEAMQAAESKLEIEALHAFGIDFLVRFLIDKIILRSNA